MYPSYIHEQGEPSAAWAVPHALGSFDLIPAFYDAGAPRRLVVPAEFELDDADNATARFASPRAGGLVLIEAVGPTAHVHVQAAPSASWAVPHALASRDLLVAIYADGPTRRLVVPGAIELGDADNATISFAAPVAGRAALARASGLRAFAADFMGASWGVMHGLRSTRLVPAFYDDGAPRRSFVPGVAEIVNTATLDATLAAPLDGRAVVYTPDAQPGAGGWSGGARAFLGLAGIR